MNPNSRTDIAISWIGGANTALGVLSVMLFPFAVPLLILTVAFVVPLLLLAIPLAIPVGVVLLIRRAPGRRSPGRSGSLRAAPGRRAR
jgi:hypothetical protein